MNQAEYAKLAEQEESYWWHQGRLKIIASYLRRASGDKANLKILNVGCGTGGTIALLEGFGETDNVDTADAAIAFTHQRGYKRVTKVDGIQLPFAAKSYDLIGAFDVLEHIDQEIAALKEWKRVLKDDGAILLTVPAYQWLWSGHDDSLHHKRRYTANRLQRAAGHAGLVSEKISYAIVFSLPLVAGFRLLHKVLRRKTTAETSYVSLPAPINAVFTWLLFLEARLHSRVRFPVGTSVVAILRKS